MTSKHLLGSAAVLFLLGAGGIVWYGRPVMKLTQNGDESFLAEWGEDEDDEEGIVAPAAPTTPAPTASTGTYTLVTVARHATQADCWSVVNDSVYDLTTWVSSHPGGTQAILNMCGKDATSAFTRRHGSVGGSQAELALLKIGSLR